MNITTIKKNEGLVAALMLFSTCFVFSTPSRAQSNFSETESLRGLRGVMVLVEKLPEHLIAEGLSKAQLEKAVEARLHKANIPVLTEPEWLRVLGSPLLWININAFNIDRAGYLAYAIEVQLHQHVILTRKPSFETMAPTWNSGSIGIAKAKDFKRLQKALNKHVDRFIKQYLEMNQNFSILRPK
ncbi:MAG: hypothetical protein ACE5HO_19600 [bacterium]